MTAPPPAFTLISDRRLRRHGLQGDVTVRFTGDGLDLTGAEGGRLVIPLHRVARLRSARESIKNGPLWQTRLWLEGEAEPLLFSIIGRQNLGGYVPAMQGLGRALAAAGRAGRLESGQTPVGAFILPVLIGALFLVACGISLFVITNEPWWGRMIVPILPGVLFVLTIMLGRRLWPRRVKNVEQYCARVDGWG